MPTTFREQVERVRQLEKENARLRAVVEAVKKEKTARGDGDMVVKMYARFAVAPVDDPQVNDYCGRLAEASQNVEDALVALEVGHSVGRYLSPEQIQQVREALEELAWAGVEFSDPRIDYISIQVDCDAQKKAQTALSLLDGGEE